MALFAVVEKRLRSRTKERSPPVTLTSFHLSDNSIVKSNTIKCPVPCSPSASSSSLETVASWNCKIHSEYDELCALLQKSRKSPVPRHPHYTQSIQSSRSSTTKKRHTRRKAKCRECLSYNSSHSASSSSLATSTTSSNSLSFNSLSVTTTTTTPQKCVRKKRHSRRARRKNMDKIDPSKSPTRKHKLSISSSGIEMDNSEEHMCKIFFLFIYTSHS